MSLLVESTLTRPEQRVSKTIIAMAVYNKYGKIIFQVSTPADQIRKLEIQANNVLDAQAVMRYIR